MPSLPSMCVSPGANSAVTTHLRSTLEVALCDAPSVSQLSQKETHFDNTWKHCWEASAKWATLAAHGGALLGAKWSCELRIQHLVLHGKNPRVIARRVDDCLRVFSFKVWNSIQKQGKWFWFTMYISCLFHLVLIISFEVSKPDCLLLACTFTLLHESAKFMCKNRRQTMLCSKQAWSRGQMPRWHLTLLTVEDWGGWVSVLRFEWQKSQKTLLWCI